MKKYKWLILPGDYRGSTNETASHSNHTMEETTQIYTKIAAKANYKAVDVIYQPSLSPAVNNTCP